MFLTLPEALTLAYRDNPSLGVSRFNLRALDEGYVQARAEQRFTVQADLSQGNSQATAVNPRANLGGGITVSQPIYSGGRTTADIAAAAASVRSGREALRGSEGDILLQVITSYVDVRRDERSLAIRRDDLVVLRSTLREIEARRVAGELTATDVAQADAQIRLAETLTTSAEAQVETSRAAFAAVVGREPRRLALEPPLVGVPRSVDLAYKLGEDFNPEVAQARYNADSSAERISGARAGLRPTVSARSTLGVVGQTDPFRLTTQRPEFNNVVTVTIPILSGGRLPSVVRQAINQNAADQLRIEEARRGLYQSIQSAWNADVAARRNTTTQEAQLAAARTLLEGTLSEYRLGLRSTFDVLFAEQTLRDTLLALVASERDLYVADATLLRRVGSLDLATLLDTVPDVDAVQHLHDVERRDRRPWDGVFALLDRAARPGRRGGSLVLPAAGHAVAPARPVLDRTAPATFARCSVPSRCPDPATPP